LILKAKFEGKLLHLGFKRLVQIKLAPSYQVKRRAKESRCDTVLDDDWGWRPPSPVGLQQSFVGVGQF
jgi:hypothetical protein